MPREDYNTYTYTHREDVSHIPKVPFWMAIIRIFQLLLAILVLALCAVGGNAFTFTYFQGYGMGVFCFVWTLLFLGYISITPAFFPIAYNIWAHLALESLTTLFWLVAFALLAQEAAAWNALNYAFSGFGGFKRSAEVANAVVARADDVARVVAPRATSTYASDYLSAANAAADAATKKYNTAIACTKAAAALGAFEWVLFIATLIGLGIFVHQQRMAALSAGPAPAQGAPVQGYRMEEHKMEPITSQTQIPAEQQHVQQQNMA